MRGRFAPSPTGELHFGSLSTAWLAYRQVRAARGTFVLRVEDLDRPRVLPGMAAAQLQALRAVGLTWDEGPDLGGPFGPYRQSERGSHYAAALATLTATGAVYPCFCSRKELRQAATAVDGEDGPPYLGTCRSLSAAALSAHARAGHVPALRFRVRAGVVRFDDLMRGAQAQDVQAEVGDFVVRRKDGIVAYQLAVVVDDIAMAIDNVLRGADLLSSTARQLLLYEAFRARPPVYAHVPLWLGDDGKKLSKRHGAIGIHTQLAAGRSPQSLIAGVAEALGLSASGDLDLATMDPGPRLWRP